MITMFKTAAALAIVGATGFATQPANAAHLSLGFGIAAVPAVVTYAPASVYYAPAVPTYAAPAYGYVPPAACAAPAVAPAPVVYAPPTYYSVPTYYSAPVYYSAPSIGFRFNFFGGHGRK